MYTIILKNGEGLSNWLWSNGYTLPSVLTLQFNPIQCHACYEILKPLCLLHIVTIALMSFGPYIQQVRCRSVASNAVDKVTFSGIPCFVSLLKVFLPRICLSSKNITVDFVTVFLISSECSFSSTSPSPSRKICLSKKIFYRFVESILINGLACETTN